LANKKITHDFSLVRLLLTCVIAFVPTNMLALDFTIHPNNSDELTAVLATGSVIEGDTERLDAFLSRQPKRAQTAIYLAGPGGSLYEGMRLGRYFSRNGIKTIVEGGRDCASACALAFLGGRDRSGQVWRSSSDNSRLGFHAFTSSGQTASSEDQTQRVVSDVLSYSRDVEAPLELMIINFATPSQKIYWLSQLEICGLGIRLWSNTSNRFLC
jgi:hypothetical protein